MGSATGEPNSLNDYIHLHITGFIKNSNTMDCVYETLLNDGSVTLDVPSITSGYAVPSSAVSSYWHILSGGVGPFVHVGDTFDVFPGGVGVGNHLVSVVPQAYKPFQAMDKERSVRSLVAPTDAVVEQIANVALTGEQ